MLSNNEATLLIFERFEKIHRPDDKNATAMFNVVGDGINITSDSFITYDAANLSIATADGKGSVTHITHVHKKNLLETLMEMSKAVKGRFPTKRDFKEMMFNPIKYFHNIKMSLQVMYEDEFIQKLNALNTLYDNAKATNQIALYEQMERERERIKRELIMIKAGYDRFIEEKDIVKFSKFSKRRVKLDWIKNFARIIPEPIQEMVKDLEKLRVFDNYVILHYDPEDTGTADTQEEIERKKDPIIFGVCECSHRLYYIADWIDEYCNLTMDRLLSVIEVDKRVLELDQILAYET